MPTSIPVPTKVAGDVFTSAMWNSYLRDNVNKLLSLGHRVLTVAQFAALTGLEDGDEAYLEVDATNGVVWHLRYVAAEPTYKWRFLGGPPMVATVDTAENVTTTTYADATTPGPSLVTPRAGDYDITTTVDIGDDNNSVENHASPNVGGVTPLDADGIAARVDGSSIYSTHRRTRRKLAVAASATVKVQYKRGVSNGQHLLCRNRQLELRPVRIS